MRSLCRLPKMRSARLFVHKQKSAKVRIEFLNAGAHGNEIVIGAQVVQLHFDEGFLQSQMRVESRRAFAHIRADDSQFPHIQIIQAELGRDADAPVHWLEGSVAVKQVEGEAQSLIQEKLFAAAEESGELPGCAALASLGVGTRRPSRNVSAEPVKLKKHLLTQELPARSVRRP